MRDFLAKLTFRARAPRDFTWTVQAKFTVCGTHLKEMDITPLFGFALIVLVAALQWRAG